MERLSSCYFCGAAVDAPVDEYPVVPRDLDPDDEQQATVALCPACRRKLATVVETVLDAVGSPVDAGAAGADAAADENGGGDDDEGVTADDGTTGAVEVDDPLGAADAGDGTDAGTEPGDPEDGGATADAENDGGSAETDPDAELADGDDTADGDDALDGLSVSTREYNRVMRLLGNREFPVDRSEFEMVASNAYDVSPGQVGAILDVAIGRGLIAEEDDRLVRAD